MVKQETLKELALSKSEYNLIVEKLDREPNDLELGLFGALWSEHCGYKHTKKLLRTIRSKSDFTLTEAGEENAGAINIGSNKAIVMKIESHNHPSAIEPYEGAATGVGGIVRDIFAMGARPIALLNSLRFSDLEENRNLQIAKGVIEGISGYGNEGDNVGNNQTSCGASTFIPNGRFYTSTGSQTIYTKGGDLSPFYWYDYAGYDDESSTGRGMYNYCLLYTSDAADE